MENYIKKIKEGYEHVLVTGGAGFIGSHICEALVKGGVQVTSLDNYSAGKAENLNHLRDYPNFREVNVDITDMINLPRYFEGIDLVFHNAASKKNICMHDPRRDLEVNAKGTFNLLELSKAFKVKKFVHASTGSVYGEALYHPQDEKHPLNPVSYYGVSKLAGERYVTLFNKIYGLNTSILRYFHVYGSRQESNEFGGVVAIFIRNMVENKTPVIFGDGSQERSFTHVNDVVKANLLMAARPDTKGEIYNCASAISVTINELCERVLEAFGKKGKLQPIYKDWVVGDIKVFNIDNSKIKAIGMEFSTDFQKELGEIIETLRKQ